MNIQQRIVQPKALWLMFVAMLALMVGISLIARHYELSMLDEVRSPNVARAIIDTMSDQQLMVHALITATLDVLYPLLYGAFFAGMALRCFQKAGKVLAILVLIAVPCDLLEGLVQVLALTGVADLLAIKAVVTPVKLLFFLLGWVIVLVGLVKSLWSRPVSVS